jgi:tight adherence protein C
MNSSNMNKVYSAKAISRINKKIKLLGINCHYNPITVLNIQMYLTIISFIISLILFNKKIYIVLIVTALTYVLFEYFFLDLRIIKRRNLLNKEAIFFFQILSLTLNSGNNLKNAIELTCTSLNNELSLEFKKVIDDVNMGNSLTDGLNELKERIPSDIINNIILNLTESNIYGNNIVESLDNELIYLNDKLLLDVKAKINKMPIKISIASVLIFIPIILLIILGPIIIELVNS